MRRMLKWIVACSAAVVIPAILAACNSDNNNAGDPVTVRVIAMNDFHGNIEVPAATNGGTVVVTDPAHPAGTALRTGGAAFVATLLKQLRGQQANSILVGAGDMIGASPVTSRSRTTKRPLISSISSGWKSPR